MKGNGSGRSHLRDASLGGDVEAILCRSEAFHLQDFGGDGKRSKKYMRPGLFKAYCFIHGWEGDTVFCGQNTSNEFLTVIYTTVLKFGDIKIVMFLKAVSYADYLIKTTVKQ